MEPDNSETAEVDTGRAEVIAETSPAGERPSIDVLVKRVEAARAAAAEGRERLAELDKEVRAATAELQKELGVAGGSTMGRPTRESVPNIDIVLMAAANGSVAQSTVRDIGKSLGRLLPASLVYQKAYRHLTEKAAGGKRKLTAEGKARLKKTLLRPEAQQIMAKVEEFLAPKAMAAGQ